MGLLPMLLQAQSPPALDRATALMRDYARGMTENVFDVRVKISEFVPDGKLRRVKNTTHRMSFVKGRFRGTEPDVHTDWESTLVVNHASRSTLGLEMFTDRGVWDPIFAVSPGARLNHEWAYESDGDRVLKYRAISGCHTFEPDGVKFRFARQICGSGELRLQDPLSMTFQAVGLPLSFGKDALREYRNESTYRKVALPGSQELFLIPATATATFVFASHTLIVEAVYTLRK